MIQIRRKGLFRLLFKKVPWLFVFCALLIPVIRVTKGAGFVDAFSLITRPLWPGPAQREWIQNGYNLEQKMRIQILEEDNHRLRKLLDLQTSSINERMSAAVISRSPRGWWQQLEINKGLRDGVKIGQAVVGPGGLVGLIDSATPITSRVQLLTAPGSKVGVWINRSREHGILLGIGTNRPQLNFLNKETNVEAGDVVTTSPASTLLPANLTIGIVQYVNKKALPTPYAMIQLIASPEAIDWVQIINN